MDVPPKCVNSGKLVKLTLKLAGRNVKLVTLIEENNLSLIHI